MSHLAGSHVCTRDATCVVQLKILRHIQVAVVVNTCFPANRRAVDRGASVNQVDVPIGIHAITLTVYRDVTTSHVDGVVELSFVDTVTIRRVDGVVRGRHVDVATKNVNDSSLKALDTLRHVHIGTVPGLLVAHSQNVVGMNGIVSSGYGNVAAQDAHVIVTVNAIVRRIYVERRAIDYQAGVVRGLDAVLCVAVYVERAIARQVDLRASFYLNRCAVVGICHSFVRGLFVRGILVVCKRDVALHNDLHLGVLVYRKRRPSRTGKIEIVEHQNDAGSPLFHGYVAIACAARDHIRTRVGNLHLAILVAHGVARGVLQVGHEVSRGVFHVARNDVARLVNGTRDLLPLSATGLLARLARLTLLRARLARLALLLAVLRLARLARLL